ncbi:cysteine desulfurase [Patescibacteria group bacterium]|nr:cysteine desulfurase [Patescibacteria group bacterium]
MKIYLDNAATTKVDPRVLKAMSWYNLNEYGNASSLHFMGDASHQAIQEATKQIAKILNCDPKGLIFTSGATEANNLIIKGLMRASSKKHLIVSEIEHPSILSPAKELEKEGFSVSYAPISPSGHINIKALEKLITKNTALISIMAVNNEIGTVQNIKKIAALAHKHGAYFHTDAVQAIPYQKLNILRDNIDFLSLSAHKFHGPKGMGLAYINPSAKIAPQQTGGGQAHNLRAGTYNTPGIVGMAEALRIAYKERDQHLAHTKELQALLLKGISQIPGTTLNGSLTHRNSNNLNIIFNQVEGEAILLDLSEKGICVSTGSACSAKSLRVSHVLKALQIDKNQLNSSIRFSLSKFTTKGEIQQTIKALKQTIKRLRSFTALT